MESAGFRPLEFLEFLGVHFLVYSPLLFAALVWAIVRSWRRSQQQLKGIYLLWFGIPVFALYALLSFNKAANANWDALAFPSLALLACSYWREKAEGRPRLQRWIAVALVIALPMSIVALNSDLLGAVGFKFPKRDPADRLRGWRSATEAVEEARAQVETQLGERVFVIADARDRASELSFYFREKRREGPGHPEVYLIESQDIQNQFSFWPRYDEFVDAPPKTAEGEGDVYTEESGVNLFEGRSAIYIQASIHQEVARNIRQAFQSTEPFSTIEVRHHGRLIRTLQVFICKGYRTLPL